MTFKLPPRYVNTPAHDLFDAQLPDAVYRTLAVLHALAWESKGEYTPPATVEDLAKLRNLQVRQMYNHLKLLKERRRIRVENKGHQRIVIYPLRWEPGAASPSETQSTLTEQELAELTADKINPLPEPVSFTAKNCSETAKDCSQHHVVDSLIHDSESELEIQHHEHHVTAKNCSDLEVAQQIAEIFRRDGDSAETAEAKAIRFVQKYGLKRCQTQLNHFAQRCELAQANSNGLRNPSGLFVRSVQENWSPPLSAESQQPSQKTWYTPEEFEQLIEH